MFYSYRALLTIKLDDKTNKVCSRGGGTDRLVARLLLEVFCQCALKILIFYLIMPYLKCPEFLPWRNGTASFPAAFLCRGKEEHKTNTGMQRCDILTNLLAKSRSLFSHLSQQDPVLMCSVKEHISLWPTCSGACSVSSVEENISLLPAEVVPKYHLSTVLSLFLFFFVMQPSNSSSCWPTETSPGYIHFV